MAPAHDDVRTAPAKRSRSGKAKTVKSAKLVFVHADQEVAKIQVSKTRFKQIETRVLSKLIAGYADTVAEAKRSGRTVRLTYVVTPDGKAETVSAEETPGSPLDAALARAKVRGATKIVDILKGSDMLTARDFGPLIGASHETVNAKRKRDEVLGLEGATRGVKYPRWQVTDAGLPLPGLAKVFAALGEQPWTVFRFLLTEHADLGGRTAVDALKSGQVDAVVGVAENSAVGAFS